VVILAVFIMLGSIFSSKVFSFGSDKLEEPTIEEKKSSSSSLCINEKEYNAYIQSCSSVYSNYSILLPKARKLENTNEQLSGLVQSLEQRNNELVSDVNRLTSWFYLCEDYTPPLCPTQYMTTYIQCSGSMRPNFDCNFQPKVYAPEDRNDVKVCDVISFNAPPSVSLGTGKLFHRIIGINNTNGRYITKGDATAIVDSYQPKFEDIISKVCYG